MNSSVSTDGPSIAAEASSSRASGGRPSPGKSVNSGRCFSLSTRSETSGGSSGVMILTGARGRSPTSSATTASRSAAARAPRRRSRQVSSARQPPIAASSTSAPTRSATSSQDTPVNKLTPAINSASSSRVAPVMPSPAESRLARVEPSAPPAPAGSPAAKAWMRRASNAEPASNNSSTPTKANAADPPCGSRPRIIIE